MNISKHAQKLQRLSKGKVLLFSVSKYVLASLTLFTIFSITAHSNTLNNNEARICLSIGLFAKISNLDNIEMKIKDGMISGAENTIYEGLDTFHVLANGPVRIIATGNKLTHSKKNIIYLLFIR